VSVKLPIRSIAKPWGRISLPAPFSAPAGEAIGEIWFEPPAVLDRLLVKYIFTSEALSVQVHPADAQLAGQGKEECWLVIAAEPDAKLGIGFTSPVKPEQIRTAALDGSLADLLAWHPVKAGDFFYIPAGTVHAIGAGISLIEVQQNSDVTYRLYDYGRSRALHLDQGLAVALGTPYPAACHSVLPDSGEQTLVDGPLFRLDRLDGPISPALAARYGQAAALVIPRSTGVTVSGEALAVGECGLVLDLADLVLVPGAQALITQPV